MANQALTYTQNALKTNAQMSSNSTTAAAQTPPKSLMLAINGFTGPGGIEKSIPSMVQTTVSQQKGQPATTPAVKGQADIIPLDTYRAGIPEKQGSQTFLHTRVVGEENESLASISITTKNIASDIAKQIKGNTFTGTFEGDIVNMYSRFFLESVVEQKTEKYQVVETFTAFYVFFYGQRPSFYRYNGILLNDPLNKWTNDMTFFYDNFFRGTKTADISAQAVMSYDDKVVSGFIVGMNMQTNAALPHGVPFSIDFLVVDHIAVSFSADIGALLNKKVVALLNKSNAIKAQLALINKNVPSAQRKLTETIRNGKIMPASVDPVGGAESPFIPNTVRSKTLNTLSSIANIG